MTRSEAPSGALGSSERRRQGDTSRSTDPTGTEGDRSGPGDLTQRDDTDGPGSRRAALEAAALDARAQTHGLDPDQDAPEFDRFTWLLGAGH